MKCHRTMCKREAQGWWNCRTDAFYCQFCAFRINDSCRQSGLAPICSRVRERKPRRWIERFKVRCCDDLFHDWLMSRLGWTCYVSTQSWDRTPEQLTPDDRYDWEQFKLLHERIHFEATKSLEQQILHGDGHDD